MFWSLSFLLDGRNVAVVLGLSSQTDRVWPHSRVLAPDLLLSGLSLSLLPLVFSCSLPFPSISSPSPVSPTSPASLPLPGMLVRVSDYHRLSLLVVSLPTKAYAIGHAPWNGSQVTGSAFPMGSLPHTPSFTRPVAGELWPHVLHVVVTINVFVCPPSLCRGVSMCQPRNRRIAELEILKSVIR